MKGVKSTNCIRDGVILTKRSDGRISQSLSQSSCQRAKCKLVYNISACAAKLNGYIKSQREMLHGVQHDTRRVEYLRVMTYHNI